MSPARPVWRQRAARVVEQEAVGAGHSRLELDVPLPFAVAAPGQFVQLRLPAPRPVLLPRPMSVSGVARARGALRLEFLYAAVGAGTRALAALGPGAEVGVLGPLGRGFPLAHPGTPVLVAGGRGVAPLLFAADVLAPDPPARRAARSARARAGCSSAWPRPTAASRRTAAACTSAPTTAAAARAATSCDCSTASCPALAGPLVLHACGPHAMLGAVARWALARGVPALRGDGVHDGLRHRRVPRLRAAAQRRARARAYDPARALAARQPRVGDVLHRGPGLRRRRPRLGAHPVSPPRAAVDLSVRIGPMRLRNPVLTASGTFGYGDEYAHVVDVRALGGVVAKTITLEPRTGNPPGRLVETAGGLLNSIGLENVGLERFRREKLPRLRALGATLVVSLGGETVAELERLLEALGHARGIAGFELNFSCPNVSHGGARYWAVPRPARAHAGAPAAAHPPGADRQAVARRHLDRRPGARLRAGRRRRAHRGATPSSAWPWTSSACARASGAPPAGSPARPSSRWRWRAATRPRARCASRSSARAASPTRATRSSTWRSGPARCEVGTATFLRPDAALDVLAGLRAELARRGVRRVRDWTGVLCGEPLGGPPWRKRR